MIEKRSIVFVLGFLVATILAAPFDNEISDNNQSTTICPRIVTRAEWKARKPRSTSPLVQSPAPYYIVHHGGTKTYCHDFKSCSASVRAYQNMHMDNNHWQDIGYQFVIGEDGNAYEGRGWDNMGAHAPHYNDQSIGICIIGNFQNFLPNEAALKALSSLMSCGVALGKVKEDYFVIGHRQVRSTLCPGESLYKYVENLPHWTDSPRPFLSNETTSIRLGSQ